MGFVNVVILVSAIYCATASFLEPPPEITFSSLEGRWIIAEDFKLEDDVATNDEDRMATTVGTSTKEFSLVDSPKTTLLKAASDGDVSTMEQILNRYPTLFWARDASGNTALHLVVKSGSKEVEQFLKGYDACFNVRGPNLQTPLHVASTAGHSAIVKVLRSNLYRCSAERRHPILLPKDIYGDTPLTYAVRSGHVDVVTILAPFSDQDTAGASIISAMEKQNIDILYALLEIVMYVGDTKLKEALKLAWDAHSVWVLVDAIGSLTRNDLQSALCRASKDGRKAAVAPLIAAGAIDTPFDLNSECPDR